MTDRSLSVRIDRLVLRNVDDREVGDLAALVAERLRDPTPPVSPTGPISRGPGLSREAAQLIAAAVRRRIPPP
jgi:hypothetical protein